MSANASKTKYIIFHNKGKLVNVNGLELYFNDNEPYDIHNPASSVQTAVRAGSPSCSLQLTQHLLALN
jgi:hypothetical protein